MTKAMIIMTSSLRARVLRIALVLGVALIAVARPASAQLDPLLFLKTVQPNVLVVMDASLRMQRDSDEVYYDPRDYTRRSRPFEPAIGVTAVTASQYYRRKYLDLTPSGGSGTQFDARSIQTVGDNNASYATFYARTRLGVARNGVATAIAQNQSVARYSLLKMRQSSPTFSTAGDGSTGNGGRTSNADGTQAVTDLGGADWSLNLPSLGSSNSSVAGLTGPLVAADAAGQNASILAVLQRESATAGSIRPASRDTSSGVDAPVDNMLDDARAEAVRLIAADTMCRNTIVVLVVGGGEGSLTAESLSAKASTFLNVSGRRVPIYVVAIAPDPGAETELRAVAANSGGQFFLITKAMIDGVPAGSPVPEVVRAVNLATQHAFVAQSLFDQPPTVALPFGKSEEYQVTSPITGTVNLEGASDITGATLPNTTITSGAGAAIPQRQNVTVTSGFSLPGFDGKLRAFRMYAPVVDATKPTGYKFAQPTTPVRLWVASAPSDADDRNIFTVLPDGTMVAFDGSQAATLAPYLRTTDPARLIAFIRSQPLGAVVGSTPAIMDAPSLDPPPDTDYPAFKEANKNRRSMLFVGTNDGMLHAIDARLGVETWAFIPFNLLPKLRLLEYGQPVGDFNYFVDSSAKIADVKVGSEWKTYLFVGQGSGGTYYNTFDVTLDGMSDTVSPTTASAATLLSYFSSPSRITRRWSFPRDSVFDWTIATHGDVGVAASVIEKTVGETWSDPAVGQVQSSSAPWVVFVGSGFFKPSWQARPSRAGVNAGTTFYLLNAVTGAVMDSTDVGNDGLGETVDNCAAANNCTRIKNALQMDPVATGPVDSRYVDKAYIGDLDGRVWRMSFILDGGGAPRLNGAPRRLYDATAAHPLFSSMATVSIGSATQYLFVGTGSDLLPSNGVSQSYSMLVLQDAGGTSAIKTAEILMERTDGVGGDEKVTAFPSVAGDIVFFTTTTTFPTTPCGDRFTANLYAFTFIGGPAYDTNGDGAITATTTGGGKKAVTTFGDSPKVATVAGKRATAPFVVDQHLVFSAGNNMQLFGDPQDYNNGVGQVAVRILSWRDVK